MPGTPSDADGNVPASPRAQQTIKIRCEGVCEQHRLNKKLRIAHNERLLVNKNCPTTERCLGGRLRCEHVCQASPPGSRNRAADFGAAFICGNVPHRAVHMANIANALPQSAPDMPSHQHTSSRTTGIASAARVLGQARDACNTDRRMRPATSLAPELRGSGHAPVNAQQSHLS